VITGTPKSPGVSKISLSASNGFGRIATQLLTLQILSSLSAKPLGKMTAGVSAVVAVIPSISLAGSTYTLRGLPTWATFQESPSGTSSISGKPPVGSGGIYPLVFVSDSFGSNVIAQMNLVVNEAPRITSPPSTSVTHGKPFTFIASASGGYPQPIIFYVGTLPSGMKFVNNKNGTATLSGTISTKGTFYVVLSAACGQQRTQGLLVITSN